MMLVVLALAALVPATSPKAADPVGSDVIASMRRWLDGDLKGRSDLEALAANGRSDAEEALGEIYGLSGPTALRDEVAACSWYAKAAASRADSMHNLALCAEKGVGGTPDFARAAVLYRQAADRGYAKSMCALGNLYVSGRGVPKDEKRGAALCRQGAELGDPDAQTDLANYYLWGKGVPHDMTQARHWYELAAAQDQPNAEFVLGQIYWNGDGVPRNQAKAAELWKAAYKHGRVDAAPLLATWLFASWMAAHPTGDVTGLDEAIKYEEVAISNASNAAKADQEGLLNLMRAARIAATKEK
jgi:TPR repeat protein